MGDVCPQRHGGKEQEVGSVNKSWTPKLPSKTQVGSLKLFRDPFSEVFTWFALILVNQKKRTKLPLVWFFPNATVLVWLVWSPQTWRWWSQQGKKWDWGLFCTSHVAEGSVLCGRTMNLPVLAPQCIQWCNKFCRGRRKERKSLFRSAKAGPDVKLGATRRLNKKV